MFGKWFFSNMLKKGLKVIEPYFVHLYSPTAIIVKLFNVWVVAPSFSLNPSTVFRSFVHSMFGMVFFVETAARLCFAISEVFAHNNGKLPAVTNAKPLGLVVLCPLSLFNDKKLSNSLVGHINYFAHGDKYSIGAPK